MFVVHAKWFETRRDFFSCSTSNSYNFLPPPSIPPRFPLQELLPKEPTNVIDLERFLTSGQKKRLNAQLESLEKDTGIKVRLLCQR